MIKISLESQQRNRSPDREMECLAAHLFNDWISDKGVNNYMLIII